MTATIAGAVWVGTPALYLGLVIFVVGILALASTDRSAAVLLFLGYSAMEGMFKYGTGFSSVVYALKPGLTVALLLLWYLPLSQTGLRAKRPPFWTAVLLFSIWGVVQAFHPLGGGAVQSMAAMIVWWIGPAFFLLLCFNVFTSSWHVEKFCLALAAISTVVAGFAFVQFIMGQEWTLAHVPGYEVLSKTVWFTQDQGGVYVSSWRPASTTSQGGSGAVWAHLGIIVTLGLLLLPQATAVPRGLRPANSKGVARTVCLIACLLINVLGLLVSGVRLYLIVTILEAMVLMLLLSSHSPRAMMRGGLVAVVMALIAVAGFSVAQNVSGGIFAARYFDTLSDPLGRFKQDRGNNVTYLLPFLSRRPLGVGFQRGFSSGAEVANANASARGNSDELSTVNRETQFNAAAADLGLPGVVLVTIFLLGSMSVGWRSWRQLKDPRLRVMGVLLLVPLVGYNIAAFGGPTLHSADHFWMALALLAALPAIEKRERQGREAALHFAPATSSSIPVAPSRIPHNRSNRGNRHNRSSVSSR